MALSRDQTIQALQDHFAHDHLTVEEFEKRLDAAHQTTSDSELSDLVKDLPALAPALPVVATKQALVPATGTKLIAPELRAEKKSLVAVLGGVEKKGAWRVPAQLRVINVLGGSVLDFREAVFAPGITEVSVTCVMGGCEIIVPPHVHVESEGIGILGGFELQDRTTDKLGPDDILLRVKGTAFLGGCEISTRLVGESKRQARKRVRREVKQLRR